MLALHEVGILLGNACFKISGCGLQVRVDRLDAPEIALQPPFHELKFLVLPQIPIEFGLLVPDLSLERLELAAHLLDFLLVL